MSSLVVKRERNAAQCAGTAPQAPELRPPDSPKVPSYRELAAVVWGAALADAAR